MTEITWTTDEYGVKRGRVDGWKIIYWPIRDGEYNVIGLNPVPDVTGPDGEDVCIVDGFFAVEGDGECYHTFIPLAIVKELVK